MKKVHLPRLKEMINYKDTVFEVLDISREIGIYNPFTFSILLIFLFLLMGFSKREYWFLGISLTLSMTFFYFITKNQANRISLKRKAPKKGVEKEMTTTKLIFRNRSNYTLFSYDIIDSYNGNQLGRHSYQNPTPVGPSVSKVISMKWLNDGGMGKKEFKNLTVELRDPLNMFPIKVIEDKIDDIEVYPNLESLPPQEYQYNLNSYHYGDKDIQQRGYSINFMGIRDYQKGDPIKRINWKQTAKQGKTIVNIFEKNINKQIIFLYNNGLGLHSGLGAESTEEYLKDLMLAMAAENISNGNQIKLISHKTSTPWGAERSFINKLELYLMDLELKDVAKPEQFFSQTIKGPAINELEGSSILYFTPLIANEGMEKSFEDIIELARQEIPVKIFGVDPYHYVDKHFFHYGAFSGLKGHIAALDKLTKKWNPLFQKHGVDFYRLRIDPKINYKKVFLKARDEFSHD